MITLAQQVHQMVAHDLVNRNEAVIEPAYLFRHALIQEAAYRSLLRTDRIRLHSVVGRTLENLYPDRHAELAAELAYHFAAAEDQPRALRYYTLAGKHALAAYACAEAAAHFQAALALYPALGARAQLLVQLGEAQFGQSCFPEAITTWQAAVAAYRAVEQPGGVAWCYARITRAVWYTGDLEQARIAAQTGLTTEGDLPLSFGQAALLHEAARATYLSRGPIDTARRLATEALELSLLLRAQEIESDTRITLGILPDQPPATALAQLREAAALAEAIGRPAVASRAHYNLAGILIGRGGDVQAALDHAGRAAAASRLLGHAAGEFLSSALEVQCHFLLGNLSAGALLLDQVARLQHSRTHADAGDTPPVLALRAQLRAAQGDWAGATAYGEQALDAAQRSDDRETILQAGLTLGEVAWAAGDPAAAIAPLTAAVGALEPNDPGIAVRGLIAAAHAAVGAAAPAAELLVAAQAQAGPDPPAADQAALTLATARLAVVRGDWSVALSAFARAAALYATCGLRPQQAQTLIEAAAAQAHSAASEGVPPVADPAAVAAIPQAPTSPALLANHPGL